MRVTRDERRRIVFAAWCGTFSAIAIVAAEALKVSTGVWAAVAHDAPIPPVIGQGATLVLYGVLGTWLLLSGAAFRRFARSGGDRRELLRGLRSLGRFARLLCAALIVLMFLAVVLFVLSFTVELEGVPSLTRAGLGSSGLAPAASGVLLLVSFPRPNAQRQRPSRRRQ